MKMLSKMLKRGGVPHSVLNAKHHEKEAEIVAQSVDRLGLVELFKDVKILTKEENTLVHNSPWR